MDSHEYAVNVTPFVIRNCGKRQEISCWGELKLQMQTERGHYDGTAVTIVAGVGDILKAERRVDAAPSVQSVIGFKNILAPIVEAAIPEKKAETAESEVLLVISGNSV